LAIIFARLYRDEDTLLGYGLKLWPDGLPELKTRAPEVLNLEGL
jgi:hypothetical protein